jgi:hypothetical protein
VTFSHRIGDNKAEQTRLKSGGLIVAPLGTHLQGPAKPGEQGVGPLRIWPGEQRCRWRMLGLGTAALQEPPACACGMTLLGSATSAG